MNRQIVGKHWRKREADRMWAFYFLEKPDVNPHWHGLVRFFPIEGKSEAYQQAVFDENAGPTWKELVPSGTVDVQPVPMQRGVAEYLAKELGHPISYEHFVTPDEFIRG